MIVVAKIPCWPRWTGNCNNMKLNVVAFCEFVIKDWKAVHAIWYFHSRQKLWIKEQMQAQSDDAVWKTFFCHFETIQLKYFHVMRYFPYISCSINFNFQYLFTKGCDETIIESAAKFGEKSAPLGFHWFGQIYRTTLKFLQETNGFWPPFGSNPA